MLKHVPVLLFFSVDGNAANFQFVFGNIVVLAHAFAKLFLEKRSIQLLKRLRGIDFNCHHQGHQETRHFIEVGCLYKAKCMGFFPVFGM